MRRRRKNKNKTLILLLVFVICVMAAGYAAFSTDLSINVRGDIIKTIKFNDLKKNVTDSGDGLYIDPVDENRYVYRGNNPENYLIYNNEMWRILSIDEDGSGKIMKAETLGAKAYDTAYARKDSTYCTSSSYGSYEENTDSKYGCNAWAKEDGNFTNGTATGTLEKDASLNIYLNNDYYNLLGSKNQFKIQKHDFGVGYWNWNEENIKNVVENENTRIWNGNIALINYSDYMKASLIDSCSIGSTCLQDNYIYTDILKENVSCWTLNIRKNGSIIVGDLYSGKANASFPNHNYHVYPVLFLKNAVLLTGEGTKENPYKVV